MTVVRCKLCHRILKTPERIAIGIGSSCYRRLVGKSVKNRRSITTKINGNNGEIVIDGQVSFLEK